VRDALPRTTRDVQRTDTRLATQRVSRSAFHDTLHVPRSFRRCMQRARFMRDT